MRCPSYWRVPSWGLRVSRRITSGSPRTFRQAFGSAPRTDWLSQPLRYSLGITSDIGSEEAESYAPSSTDQQGRTAHPSKLAAVPQLRTGLVTSRTVPRRLVLFVSIAAAAITLGVLVLTGRLFGTEATSAYPAPARVPVVVGLTKDQAVRRIEAAHLKPVVRYKRLRRVRQGRIIAMQVTNLLHAPRLPLISLEGTPVIVFVAR